MSALITTETLGVPAFFFPATSASSRNYSFARLPHPDPSSSPPVPKSSTEFSEAQASAMTLLCRAVADESVFASITSSDGSGRSLVLKRVLEQSEGSSRVCVRVLFPQNTSSDTVQKLILMTEDATRSLMGPKTHVLFGVDNVHAAAVPVLDLLNRLARRDTQFLAAQVLLAGDPSMWGILEGSNYNVLRRRIALRCTL